jgi:Glycosyl hydrolase family 26
MFRYLDLKKLAQLSIMKPPRKSKYIRSLAALAVTAIVGFTAACSGGGTASTLNPSSGTTGSAGPTSAAGLGFYDSQFKPSGIETAANWLGSPSTIKFAQDFIDATDWSHISNPWQLSQWKGTSYTMVWGAPMIPCGTSQTQCQTIVADYNLAANGGANSYYKTLAKNLIASGFGSSYIRIGWEFNSTDMGWSICNPNGDELASWAKDFVPAFQNMVTSMRSVSGANFKFIWNPLVSSNTSCGSAAKLENFYPGDKYVDMVALDIYDGVGQTVSSDATRWNDLLKGVNGGDWTAAVPDSINGKKFQGYGLDWLTAFGKEHSKLVSIPEWGLDTESMSAVGGGDDAYFVTQMAKWIKANATGPAIFWNYGADGNLALKIPDYTIGDANTPKATAAFKAAFSS